MKSFNVPGKGSIAVKYKDTFNFTDLYKAMHWWLGDNGWSPSGTHETLYLEKWQGEAVEHLIRWELSKVPDTSKYYKFTLKVQFHSLGIKPKDTVIDGKKYDGSVNGEVEIVLTPRLIIDAETKWSEHPVLGVVHPIFYNRVFKSRIEQLKKDLYDEVFDFQGSIKKFLQLKQFITSQEQEPFHPVRSFPS